MSASACRTLAADGCARTASPAARWAAHTGWAAASAPVVAAAAAAAGQVARPPPRAMPRFAHTTSMPMSCSRQHDSAERKRRANRADGVARRPPSHSGGGEARGPPQSRVSTCTAIYYSQHLVGTQRSARENHHVVVALSAASLSDPHSSRLVEVNRPAPTARGAWRIREPRSKRARLAADATRERLLHDRAARRRRHAVPKVDSALA